MSRGHLTSRALTPALIFAVLAAVLFLPSCGGSGGSTTTTTTTNTPVANTVPVSVNSRQANSAVNMLYVTVTVCNPGSTTSCATIPNVQLDTGTSGLRILASAPGVSSLNLTPVAPGGSPIDECYQFGDGNYLWGPVMQADVSLAGEKAAGLPIQVIAGGAAPSSTTCASGGGNNLNSSDLLQANGILGVGTNQQDCGITCTGASVPPYYWQCPASGCTLSSLATAIQVSNPVTFFDSDNNGVVITLPSVGSSGAASITGGTLTFGIGTQADNALGAAHIYPLGLWPSGPYAGAYTLQASYNNVTYPAIIDSALPILYFLDPATIGVPACSGTLSAFYCPSSNVNFTVSNSGFQGTAANATITIGNAQTLLSNTSFSAFNNLAAIGGSGPSDDVVGYGAPFFYGRTVYVGIAGKVAPAGAPAGGGIGYYAF